ncbi:MAG: 4-hydroxy-tetrahydrodipicolinate reductase, partial [Reyranella sp.]
MKIAVVGAAGRMGQMLVRRIAHTEGVSLAAASESPDSNAIGRDSGEVAGLDANRIRIGGDSA